MIVEYIEALQTELEQNTNIEIATQQKAYTRNQFKFYGIKTEVRRAIQKPFLVKKYLPPKSDLKPLVETLYAKPQREFHHFAQELVFKYTKQFTKNDIVLLEFMVTHNSWWDTVDFIAVKLMGAYFKKFPEERLDKIKQWLKSGNIWLQRSALLFQLKYKEEIDKELLSTIINSLLGSDEFFINKAIGWMLREYTRTNSEWVIAFVDKTQLDSLSRREALRLIK